MKDRVPGAPGQYSAVITAEAFQKAQNGERFTLTMVRDDQPIVEGTPYSKAAVLPDEVATALCPGVADPCPADAFSAISNRLVHETDYVIEQGISNGTTYRKWASGLAECWDLVVSAESEVTFVFPFQAVNQDVKAFLTPVNYDSNHWQCFVGFEVDHASKPTYIKISAKDIGGNPHRVYCSVYLQYRWTDDPYTPQPVLPDAEEASF